MKIVAIIAVLSWVSFPFAFVLSEGSIVTIILASLGFVCTLIGFIWKGQAKRIDDLRTKTEKIEIDLSADIQKLEYDTNERFKEVTDKNSENLDRIFTKVDEIQKEQSNTQIMIAEKMATKTDIKDLHERINNKEDKRTGT